MRRNQRQLGIWLACLVAGCATGSAVDDDPIPDAAPGPDSPLPGDPNDVCANDPCDLLDQCGCPDTQVCDLDLGDLANGTTACRDVTSPGTETGACDVATDCAEGYICLGNPGQCRRFCDPDDDMCGSGAYCRIHVVYDAGGGDFQDVPGAVTCTKSCSPELASGNGCPDGFGCDSFIANSGQADEFYHTDCRSAPASGGGDGADCSANSSRDCAPGFTCVTFDPGGNETHECKQICLVPDGACSAGSCTAYSAGTPPVVDGVEYGFCN